MHWLDLTDIQNEECRCRSKNFSPDPRDPKCRMQMPAGQKPKSQMSNADAAGWPNPQMSIVDAFFVRKTSAFCISATTAQLWSLLFLYIF